jgi:hypothetical protein
VLNPAGHRLSPTEAASASEADSEAKVGWTDSQVGTSPSHVLDPVRQWGLGILLLNRRLASAAAVVVTKTRRRPE